MQQDPDQQTDISLQQRLHNSLHKTGHSFINVLPIILGMLLATSLVISVFEQQVSSGLFGHGDLLDTLLGAAIGSIAAGQAMTSYILGGELQVAGVGLIAVTALIVSWVTVGIVQLPAESLLLGGRFAVTRNLLCFGSAIVMAWCTVYTLQLLGMA